MSLEKSGYSSEGWMHFDNAIEALSKLREAIGINKPAHEIANYIQYTNRLNVIDNMLNVYDDSGIKYLLLRNLCKSQPRKSLHKST